MATHSSILAWRISWTEEPGGLQSIGLQRLEHHWSDLARTHGQWWLPVGSVKYWTNWLILCSCNAFWKLFTNILERIQVNLLSVLPCVSLNEPFTICALISHLYLLKFYIYNISIRIKMALLYQQKRRVSNFMVSGFFFSRIGKISIQSNHIVYLTDLSQV